jgi:hypothetical protein
VCSSDLCSVVDAVSTARALTTRRPRTFVGTDVILFDDDAATAVGRTPRPTWHRAGATAAVNDSAASILGAVINASASKRGEM